VGILDVDAKRVAAFLGKIGRNIPYYPADSAAAMIAETKADVVLVASPDYSHAGYIVAGLEQGCDVIVEKPMVINGEQVRRVQAAEKRSGKRVKVAFNYRYTPIHKRLKRMILDGMLGRIVNVEFTYNLDTWHGSSYFYRWNRQREKSGGLCIHKCCHHFDLINWWVGDIPEEVFAYGGLNYYGKKGVLRPRDAKGRLLEPVEEKRRCPVFRTHYAHKAKPEDKAMYTGWDSYNLPYNVQYPASRRRYIYDDAIDVEDTYSAVVRYRGGASLSYSCNFCTPWEGYILGINGTAGRVEIQQHTDPDPTGKTKPPAHEPFITYYPLFGARQTIEIPPVAGGHGGADFVIQRDLFDKASGESRELKLVAGSADGANAVAIGEAVWRSIKEERPIRVRELMGGAK
jgi:predicted dehydrogenase